MKIVRFFAHSIEDASRQVRESLGSDAIIFSHRQLREGVELLAAAKNTAEKEAPTAITQRTPSYKKHLDESQIRQELLSYLASLGFEQSLTKQLVYYNQKINYSTLLTAVRDVHLQLSSLISTPKTTLIASRHAISLIGTPLSGKTTTQLKLAHKAIEEEAVRSVIYVPKGSMKPVITQQIAPMLASHKMQIVQPKMLKFAPINKHPESQLVLIDTSPLNQQIIRNPTQYLPQTVCGLPIDYYLVLSADQSYTKLDNLVMAVTQKLSIKGSIITHVDQTQNLGQVIGLTIKHKLPIAMWSDGSGLDSHLYQADPKHLIEKMIAIHRQYQAKQQPVSTHNIPKQIRQ